MTRMVSEKHRRRSDGSAASRMGPGAAGVDPSGPPLERLADESGCPVEIIVELYEREVFFLGRGARIQSYIPVLAMKRVRDALRSDPDIARRRPQRLAAA